MLDGSVIKTSKLVFATLALTTFAQARTLRLSYEKYASILFAAFGLTVFAQARCLSV
jgi:hypothetical protein